MSIDTLSSQNEQTPPEWFTYNPNSMDDYDEQVAHAIRFQEYQDAPVPSFEDVEELDVKPKFNPSNAPDSEIYVHGRRPNKTDSGKRLRSEWTDSQDPVEIWRIVEKDKLIDGTGIVSSRVVSTGVLVT